MYALVIDGNGSMRMIIKNILRGISWEMVAAEDGKSAQDILMGKTQKRIKINLVISDWDTKRISGTELLKWVRTETERPDLPFLLLTTESSTKKIAEALKLKANGIIIKPFSSKTLEDKIFAIFPK